MRLAAFLLLAATQAAGGRPPIAEFVPDVLTPSLQQQEQVFIDEVKKDFLEKIRKCEQNKDWKGIFEHHAFALRKYAQKLVPVDGEAKEPRRWVNVAEHLAERLSKLPPEALQYYRLEYDGRADEAFARAREQGDRRALERAVDDYFLASRADEALDRLGCHALEEGRAEEAIFHWNRLLRRYPDSEIPRAVTAARVANACLVSGNGAELESLRRHVAEAKIEGALVVAGRERPLAALLGEMAIAPSVPDPRVVRPPDIRPPSDALSRRPFTPRNDVLRWTYDFAADRGMPSSEARGRQREAEEMMVEMQMRRSGAVVAGADFPLFPAHARLDGRDYVLFCDGARLNAIDPARARGTNTATGVFWKYPEDAPLPRRGATSSRGAGAMAFIRPYVGVAVDGEYAYTTLVSPGKLRPVAEDGNNNPDFFEGVTAVKCFHIPTGRLVWDTDTPAILEEFRRKDREEYNFYERNFTFSGAPVVRNGRVYVGLCTSPMTERESRVLCLDQATGRPLWCTFVASLGGGQEGFRYGIRPVLHQTLLAEHGGVIYVQSNLGAVAALHPVSGRILWVSRYDRTAMRTQRHMGEVASFIRPANWPVVWQDRVFVLPQDAENLLAFERVGGREIPAGPFMKGPSRKEELAWKSMTQLLGIVENERGETALVVGGQPDSHVCFLKSNYAHALSSSNVSQSGRGVARGDLLFLPSVPSVPPAGTERTSVPPGALSLYSLASWKIIEQYPWREGVERGNLLLAGDSLVVMGDKVHVYTSLESAWNEYGPRLLQDPPAPEVLLEFGDLMLENRRLEDAADAYLAFTRAAQGDARYEARARKVRTDLHGIFMDRGRRAAKEGQELRALEYFRLARSFAFDKKSDADSIRQMAETFERAQKPRDAVEYFQQLIEKGSDQLVRLGEDSVTIREYARRKIEEIVKKTPDAYEAVERRAAEALRAAREKGAEAIKKVKELFPNSRSAVDALKDFFQRLYEEGNLQPLPSIDRELRERFRSEPDFIRARRLVEALEKLGDRPRLRAELARLAERFPDESIGPEGAAEKVKDHVARRLAEPVEAPAPPSRGELRKVGEIPVEGTGVEAAHAAPLRVGGLAPQGFAAHLELFARGSRVELWDLRGPRLAWSGRHPGGYLGAVAGNAAVPETGASIAELRKGSPAERAGLQRGDVIVAIDGRAVTPDTLGEELLERPPRTAVEITYRRGGKSAVTKAELGEVPVHEAKCGIVGAAFTSDYALAVAWPDAVASLDLSTGAVRWSFHSVRDRFHLRGLHAGDGKLFLHEAYRHERDRDALRNRAQQERMQFPPGEHHERLLCLDDATGDLAWARAFEFPSNAPPVTSQLTFLSGPLSEAVAFLQGGAPPSSLRILASSDGRQIRKEDLPGQVMTTAADPSADVLYYVVQPEPNNPQRSLRSASLAADKKGFKPINVVLRPKHMEASHSSCALAVNREHLCLVVPPAAPGGEQRISVFKAADGAEVRSIALRDGRSIALGVAAPQAQVMYQSDDMEWVQMGGRWARGGRVVMGNATSLTLDDDGLLYLYNIPRTVAAPAGTAMPTRAYLTAFRVAAKADSEVLAWEEVVPAAVVAQGTAWSVIPVPGRYAVFTAPRAVVPGVKEPGPVAVVFDKEADGYTRAVHTGLFAPADALGRPGEAALCVRGRLYLGTKEGLQVFAQ